MIHRSVRHGALPLHGDELKNGRPTSVRGATTRSPHLNEPAPSGTATWRSRWEQCYELLCGPLERMLVHATISVDSKLKWSWMERGQCFIARRWVLGSLLCIIAALLIFCGLIAGYSMYLILDTKSAPSRERVVFRLTHPLSSFEALGASWGSRGRRPFFTPSLSHLDSDDAASGHGTSVPHSASRTRSVLDAVSLDGVMAHPPSAELFYEELVHFVTVITALHQWHPPKGSGSGLEQLVRLVVTPSNTSSPQPSNTLTGSLPKAAATSSPALAPSWNIDDAEAHGLQLQFFGAVEDRDNALDVWRLDEFKRIQRERDALTRATSPHLNIFTRSYLSLGSKGIPHVVEERSHSGTQNLTRPPMLPWRGAYFPIHRFHHAQVPAYAIRRDDVDATDRRGRAMALAPFFRDMLLADGPGQKEVPTATNILEPDDHEIELPSVGPSKKFRLEESATYFMSIASFRDAECSNMVVDLASQAKHIARVYLGIAQQHLAGNHWHVYSSARPPQYGGDHYPQPADVECMVALEQAQSLHCPAPGSPPLTEIPEGSDTFFKDPYFCKFQDNVRVRYIEPSEAKGPTYGRYMAMLLYRGEDFYFMLDSHNRFVPHWDVRLLTYFLEMKHPKAILSHYPEAFEAERPSFQLERQTTAYLCKGEFLKGYGIVRLNAIVTSGRASSLEYPQPWAAGGFLFAGGYILRDVPFDPFLEYIFDGEEVLYSVRAWTHGFDIFSPKRNIVYHMYGRAKAPKVWSEVPHWYSEQKKSTRRVQFLLQAHRDPPSGFASTSRDPAEAADNGKSFTEGLIAHLRITSSLAIPLNSTEHRINRDVGRYGMGNKRTVSGWYIYAGADPVLQVVRSQWCR